MLLLQSSPNPVQDFFSGASGWTAASLLFAVLGVVFLRLIPAKDAQIESFWKTHLETINKLLASNDANNASIRQEYKQALQQVIDHCASESRGVAASFLQAIGSIKEMVGEIARMRHEESEHT